MDFKVSVTTGDSGFGIEPRGEISLWDMPQVYSGNPSAVNAWLKCQLGSIIGILHSLAFSRIIYKKMLNINMRYIESLKGIVNECSSIKYNPMIVQ
jgi:hypothetical protein